MLLTAASDDGRIYVAASDCILAFDKSGRQIAKWTGSESGDKGFQYIQSIAADAKGNVYALDYMAQRIRRIDTTNGSQTEWKVPANGEDWSPAMPAMTVGRDGTIYLAYSQYDGKTGSYRIQEFGPTGNLIKALSVPAPLGSE